MTLSRTVVVPGMAAEYQNFVGLLRGLSDEEWETPSRCEGWRVADVAAHVVINREVGADVRYANGAPFLESELVKPVGITPPWIVFPVDSGFYLRD